MVYILQYKKDLFSSINITLLHITLKTQGFVWGFHGNKAKIYSLVWPPVDTKRILQPPLNSIYFSNLLYNMPGPNVREGKDCNTTSPTVHETCNISSKPAVTQIR